MATKMNGKRGTVVNGKTKKVYQPTQCRLDPYLNQPTEKTIRKQWIQRWYYILPKEKC